MLPPEGFVLRSLFYLHVCRGEHIFNKNAVAAFGVIDEHVVDRADQLAVLDDGLSDRSVVKKGQQFLTIN